MFLYNFPKVEFFYILFRIVVTNLLSTNCNKSTCKLLVYKMSELCLFPEKLQLIIPIYWYLMFEGS